MMITIRTRATSPLLQFVRPKRWNSKLVPKDESKRPVNASAPPPLKLSPDQLTSHKGKYTPKLTNKRVTYDYQAPPKPSEAPPPSNRSFIIRRLLPSAVLLGGGLWILFTYNYLSKTEQETEVLHPEVFTKWIITFKYELPGSPDHFVLELTKKDYQKLKSSLNMEAKSMWNGHRSWSVEICQPEINIVRSYTPLPLYVGSVDHETGAPFLKVIDGVDEEGKFLLYIKKYDQGEMARWLSRRPLFSEILVRGPFEDFKLPYSPTDNLPERETVKNVPSKILPEGKIPGVVKPDNLVFYAAGTGITPILQMLYSRNPPKGHVDIFWSLNNKNEILKNFSDLNFILEKLGRASFHYRVADDKEYLAANEIKPPAPKNYQGFKSLELVVKKETEIKIKQIRENTKLSENEKEDQIAKLVQDPNDKLYQPGIYKTQLEQYNAIKDKLQIKDPALAIVCGPDGYLSYVCGPKNLNNSENIDVGPISGLLGSKGWDKSNVIRL